MNSGSTWEDRPTDHRRARPKLHRTKLQKKACASAARPEPKGIRDATFGHHINHHKYDMRKQKAMHADDRGLMCAEFVDMPVLLFATS